MNLPLNQINKRKYSIWLETSGANEIGQTALNVVDGEGVQCTYDLIYDLPMPLQSESGLFNVSLKSFNFDIGQYDDEPYCPAFSGLEVSLANVTSGYNCVIKNNPENIMQYESVTNSYQLCPVGSINVWNNNSIQKRNVADGAIEAIGSHLAHAVQNVTINDYKVTTINPGDKLHIVLTSIRSKNNLGINSAPSIINVDTGDLFFSSFPYRLLLQFEEV